ncbi:MAG: oligosaccharide flippase family protein [Candidatus Dormibacteraeota bacterium]|nr:oligosaccharide flippase family protein [Candidatus Dormibacteraeota bacterium]
MSTPLSGGGRVARNVVFNVVSQAWLIVLVIVSVPIVLHGIGAAAYGVFVLASLVLGYTALLDLGLTPAVIRSIAIHHATGDTRRLQAVIATAMTMLLILGVLVGGLLVLLTPIAVDSFLHVPASLRSDARFVLYVAAAGFACNMVLLLFVGVAQGLQRLDLFASRTVALGTAIAVAQVVTVKMGGGLRGLAAVTIALNVVSLLVFVIVGRRLLPTVSFRPGFDRSALSELMGFGAMKFINQAAVQVIFHVDRLIVAAFLPIAAVSYYAVPVSICQKFILVQQAVNQAFFPAAAELHALDDRARLQRLYRSAVKLGLTALLPFMIIPSILAYPLLAAWIGPSFAGSSAPILAVLAVAYGVVAVSSVAGFAADATGHPDWNAAFTVGSAILNLTLALVLVPRIGAIGAAYALLINGVALLVSMNYAVQRWLIHISLRSVLTGIVVRPLLAGASLTVVTLLVAPHVRGLAQCLAAVAGGFLTYAGFTLLFRVFDAQELALARGLASSLRARLGRVRAA